VILTRKPCDEANLIIIIKTNYECEGGSSILQIAAVESAQDSKGDGDSW